MKKRFPPRADVLSVLVACAFPVFGWAVISYLFALPGFLVRLSPWDVVGTASYPLAFALFESIVLSVPFVLTAFILPSRFFRDRFVALSATIVFISSVWMMYANYYRIDLAGWESTRVLKALTIYALSLALPILMIVRSKRIEEFIRAVVERLSVLMYAYMALGCVGAIIVLIRNL